MSINKTREAKKDGKNFIIELMVDGKRYNFKGTNANNVENEHDKFVVDSELYGRELCHPENYPEFLLKNPIKCKLLNVVDNVATIQIAKGLGENKVQIEAIVDEEDYEKISIHSWSDTPKNGIKTSIKGSSVYLHRYILENIGKSSVTHKNGDKRDNRKENLMCGSNIEMKSSKAPKNKEYKGVFTKRNKFEAKLHINNRTEYIGSFNTKLEAAEEYDKYVINNGYNKTYLNFPEKKESFINPNYKKPTKGKKDKTSKYEYVNKKGKKWEGRINGKNNEGDQILYRKIYESEIDCAKACDKFIVDNNLNKSLNFPEDYVEFVPSIRIVKTLFEPTNDPKIVRIILETRPDIIALIDKNRYDDIKYYCWSIWGKYINGHVNGCKQTLHSFLFPIGENFVIDHIDGNIYNNTMANLRKATTAQNAQNRTKTQGKYSSDSNGISYNKNINVWNVSIGQTFITTTDNEEVAKRFRDLYIKINLKDSFYNMACEWNDEDEKYWMTRYNNHFAKKN